MTTFTIVPSPLAAITSTQATIPRETAMGLSVCQVRTGLCDYKAEITQSFRQM